MPRAFPHLSGCGGAIKAQPADFRVEELPAYLPAGEGEHLYVEIEKTGLTTASAVRRLAEATGLAPAQVGHAGLKDTQAVTTQWLSLQGATETDLAAAEGDGLRILRVGRHRNKLRPGHLAGNRFDVLVRGAVAPPDFPALLAAVQTQGFPNTFGPQRFGRDGDNAARGKRLLLSGFRERMPVGRARLLTNAYQADLFNRLVARRLAEVHALERMLPGDLAVFHAGRAFFAVTVADADAAAARARTWEISASAPLFGHKTPRAEGEPGRWECELLAAEGIAPETFHQGGKRLAAKGERRPVRARPTDLTCVAEPQPDGPALRLRFTLPPGTYATALLAELMGAPPDAPEPQG